MTVLVEGDRITAVGPDDAVEVPRGAEVIDGEGKMLLPGMWDMHAHLYRLEGLLNIASGVTAVRDLGNATEELFELRRQIMAGGAIGPRIVMAGFIDGSGPLASSVGVRVSTEEEARRAVDRYADLGYVQIKLYTSMRPELVPVIVQHARARGLRVSGHIPAGMTADAVRHGYDEIHHMDMLYLDFLDDTLDTGGPDARHTAVARHGAQLDLTSDSVRRWIQLLKEHDVVVDPTLVLFEELFTSRPDEPSEGGKRIADRLPAQTRGWLYGGLDVAPGMDDQYRNSFRAMQNMARALHEAGIRLVPGVDSHLTGLSLHRELELYVEAGIPAAEVLQLATHGAATVAGVANSLGSIAPGKLADLIIVDGNPISDIDHIRRIAW